MGLELTEFDEKYYKSLPDHEKISINKEGFYHTILKNHERAGIVGFIPSKKDSQTGFVQILISPEFQGQGLLQLAEDLLARKYNLTQLYATIQTKNISSMKSHQKAGFTVIPLEELKILRKKGFLKSDETRLVKHYTL